MAKPVQQFIHAEREVERTLSFLSRFATNDAKIDFADAADIMGEVRFFATGMASIKDAVAGGHMTEDQAAEMRAKFKDRLTTFCTPAEAA
jgi:hypothetical protein